MNNDDISLGVIVFSEEDVQLLAKLGFTKNQTKLYLALLKLGETDAKSLVRNTNVSSAAVYRTLGELQKKGLVEKVIDAPLRFKATPMQFGLQILIKQRAQQCDELQKEIKDFLRKNQKCLLRTPREEEYKLVMVEGRERVLRIKKIRHNNVHLNVNVLSTLQRWLQILDSCFENYMKALERKVRYRVVIEKPAGEINFPENVKALMAKPYFELKISFEPLKCNMTVFDKREAAIDFFLSKSLTDSPLILTNHPGLLQMCLDHFEKTWKSAQNYELQNKNCKE